MSRWGAANNREKLLSVARLGRPQRGSGRDWWEQDSGSGASSLHYIWSWAAGQAGTPLVLPSWGGARTKQPRLFGFDVTATAGGRTSGCASSNMLTDHCSCLRHSLICWARGRYVQHKPEQFEAPIDDKRKKEMPTECKNFSSVLNMCNVVSRKQ